MKLRLSQGKKGEMTFIVATILVLLSMFMIGLTIERFLSRTTDLEAELLCQTSIAQRAKTAVNVGETDGFELKLAPPLCKTIDKEISGSREQILKEVSDKMARCWWMFGEGKYDEILDKFSTKGYLKVMSFEGLGQNNCFNCYTILVAQDEIPGGPIEAPEINDYLRTKTYAKVGKTYLDYIQGYGGPGSVVFTVPEILPNHGYTISMLPKNYEQSAFWTGAFFGTVAGIAFPPVGIIAAVFFGVSGGLAAEGVEAYLKDPNYLTNDDYLENVKKAYAERDVSKIFFSSLEVGEELCRDGDIAGQQIEID